MFLMISFLSIIPVDTVELTLKHMNYLFAACTTVFPLSIASNTEAALDTQQSNDIAIVYFWLYM